MNESSAIQPTTAAKSLKMLQAMVGIGVLCALFIVLTYEGTKPRIEQLRKEALQQAIFEVLPGITKTKTYRLTTDGSFAEGEAKENEKAVYAGYDDSGQFMGLAIEASGMGYADVIRILYGYDPSSQKVVGFQVLESKETPGLGDKIEKDETFLSNFEALDVGLNDDNSAKEHTVVTVKSGEKKNAWEIDGITGATISSRAIGDIIDQSTAYWLPIIHKRQNDF